MSEKYKFKDANGVYFVTPTIVSWIDLFTKKEYNNILDARLVYLHNNPIEQGIVSNAIDYNYSSARDYAGDKGLLHLLLIE